MATSKKPIKTKFAGVYKNPTTKKYFYLSKIKSKENEFKSVRSQAIYDSAIECFKELEKIRDENAMLCEAIKNGEELTEERKEELKFQVQANIKPKIKFVSFERTANEWLNLYKTKVKYNTYYVVERIVNNQIIPLFENQTIKFACESKTIIEFKNHLSQLKVRNEKRNRIISIYKAIIEYSYYSTYITQNEYGFVKINLVKFNDVSEVEKPKRKKRVKYFYTLDEFKRFVFFLSEEKEIEMILYMLFFGGFRIGELLALKKEDVNFDLKFVKVFKALSRFNKEISTTKTKNSIRRVYLPLSVIERLRKYCNDKGLKNDDLLFTIKYEYMCRKLVEYSKATKCEYLNLHGYRHSCCSYLFQKYKEKNIAIDFKSVADHLGDNVNTVLEVYYHLYGKETEKLSMLLEDD